jgi:hypothetical protein
MIRRFRPKGYKRQKWIGVLVLKKIKNRKASLLLVPVCVRIKRRKGKYVDVGARVGGDVVRLGRMKKH